MKILVPIKRVPDYQAKVKINSAGTDIETAGVKWVLNPFDEIAVEEAIKLKEAGKAAEITVVSIGPEDVAQTMRSALAMGADKGILVKHDGVCDSMLAARALAEIYKKGDYKLVIMGKQAVDSDCSQTPQILASILKLPQACFASKVIIEEGSALVTREVDGGLENLKINLPAVISTDLRLNTPRYASLPGIMAAKKKPLEIIDIKDFNLDLSPKVKIVKMSYPAKRVAGKKFNTVEELISAVKEAKIL